MGVMATDAKPVEAAPAKAGYHKMGDIKTAKKR